MSLVRRSQIHTQLFVCSLTLNIIILFLCFVGGCVCLQILKFWSRTLNINQDVVFPHLNIKQAREPAHKNVTKILSLLMLIRYNLKRPITMGQ